MFQISRFLSKSAVATKSSLTCGFGLDGGSAARKLVILLDNSVLYTAAVMFDKSIELERQKCFRKTSDD